MGLVVVAQQNEPEATAEAVSLSVLVVDDDREICAFLEDFLSAEGHSVTVLSDSTQAIDVLKNNAFHICIIDLMMPKLSGTDLLSQIRQVDDDIAIIVLTGYPSLESATVSIEQDVSAYLEKPCSINLLREHIARIAKRKGLVLRREEQLHRTIGSTIRGLRKVRGLTLKQLSRRTNLSVSLLSQIERAESSASVSSLFKIAAALGVPLTELFGDF